MLRNLIFIFIAAGCISAAVFAQDGGREAFPFRRIPHLVKSAEVVRDSDSYQLVVTGEIGDGCVADTIINTERVGATWFVDIYRDVPFDQICPDTFRSVPYEERIDASVLFEDAEDETAVRVIVVNGKLFVAEPGEPESEEQAAPVLTDLAARGQLPYETIRMRHTQEADMEITLAGTLTDGCAIPVYRAVPDYQNEGFVRIEAYIVIPLNAMCLQANVPFEAMFNAPVFDSIAINGVGVPFNPALSVEIQEFVEQPLSVTSATAEWVEGFLPNLKITVRGVTDGCDFPIQVVPQPPTDGTQFIKVVRVVPQDTVCPMIARDFEAEVYVSPEVPMTEPRTLVIGDQMLEVKPQ